MKKKNPLKGVILALVAVYGVIIAVFFIGRFGWKLRGFEACEQATVESVDVTEKEVHIKGSCGAQFPEGYVGYFSEEADGVLEIGFHFDSLFGAFSSSEFDIVVPVENEVKEVAMRIGEEKTVLWNEENGFLVDQNAYGVHIRWNMDDVYTINMTYNNMVTSVDLGQTEIVEGEYLYIDNDIQKVAQREKKEIPFTLTVQAEDGTVVSGGEFIFGAETANVFYMIMDNGEIVEEKVELMKQ